MTKDAGRRGSPFVYDPFGSIVRQDVVGGETTVRFLTIPATATTDRAVYTHQTETGDAQIAEWSILSADRIGVDRTTQAVSEAVTSGDIHYRHVGSTLYELTDQVGSVRAVISDVVDPDPNNPGRFQARVLSRSDYEPYGARRTKRFIDLESAYRYGWQGMRLLDGVDQRVDYVTPFRLYDVRVGRWTSSDPLFDPSASSYEGLWSNPLVFTDPLGLTPSDVAGGTTESVRTVDARDIRVVADRWTPEDEVEFQGHMTLLNSLTQEQLVNHANGMAYQAANGLSYATYWNTDGSTSVRFYSAIRREWSDLYTPETQGAKDRRRMEVTNETLQAMQYTSVGLIVAPVVAVAAIEATPVVAATAVRVATSVAGRVGGTGVVGAASNTDVRKTAVEVLTSTRAFFLGKGTEAKAIEAGSKHWLNQERHRPWLR